ncbi:DUF6279 family lipoprotein [Zwartia sp.]|uniref:DUF6279 family lipoprotein n=1 Tax=Zwartia sp. TaxID=2978004 RepID=UPI00271F8A80|nr:DUF6279 family lipoprotein [Zwartia sp.]MDO9025963.1 DUF6279 family lipoprotein [Zwartia sp.]
MYASNSLMQLLKLCVAASLAIMLAACSSVQLAYNYAPGLIAYRMNGYLNLDETQQALLDQELAAFTAWHEETALPQYTKMLNQWATRAASDQPFQAEEILSIQETVEQQLQALGVRASQQLGPLLVTLGPQQIKQLQSKFDASNKEYFADYLKNADSPSNVKKRHARVIKRFEDWLGPLTAAQQKTLTDVSDARAPIISAWDAERRLRQRALVSLLSAQRDVDPAKAQVALQNYLASLNQYRESSLNTQRDKLRLEWAQATASVLNSASPAQKNFLQKKLRGYAQDFAALTPKRVAQNAMQQ